MNLFRKRAFKILMITLGIYGLLVATHKGEFWPFSIYPMFSKAGNPWTRAIVRDATQIPDSLLWKTTSIDAMRGSSVALIESGVDQIDFSNYISKTDDWDLNRKNALITMFDPDNIGTDRWLICKVQGHLTNQDSVIVDAIPFLLVTKDTVFTNPMLPESSYTPNADL